MSTIQTAIQMTDGVTPALRQMRTAVEAVIDSLESMRGASGNAIDPSGLERTRSALDQMNRAYEGIAQEIQDAEHQQDQWNQSMAQGEKRSSWLWNLFKKTVSQIDGGEAVQKLLSLSDQTASMTARLNLMNDGSQSTDELKRMIFESAQRSRGSYLNTAASISKMGLSAGSAFSSNAELVAFMEQINKQFVVAGAGTQEIKNSMLQLTQAMGAGALRGEELNSVLEAAPTIARSIEKYMGIAEGSIKTVAEQGKITSQVVKNAMLAAAEETNRKFQSMPKTFEQIFQGIKNQAVSAFDPVLARLNQTANSEGFQRMVVGIIQALRKLSVIALNVLDSLLGIAGEIVDRWDQIGPVVLGAAKAFLALKITLAALHGVQRAGQAIAAGLALVKNIQAAASARAAGASFLEMTAQYGLNAAMLACPITWIVGGLLLLVGLTYAVVAGINAVTGSTISATGVICGALATVGAVLWNLVIGAADLILGVVEYLVNPILQFCNFLANVFVSPVSSIIYLFQGLADSVLAILKGIARAIDSVFGSNLSGAVSGWRSGLKGFADSLVQKWAPQESYEEIIPSLDLNMEKLGVHRIAYGGAWDAGYDFGKSIEDTVKGLFDFNSLLPDLPDPAGEIPLDFDVPSYEDLAAPLQDIEKNTGRAADGLEGTDEDLKYLRDLAERDAVNRFTTAQIKLDMVNHNTVSGNMDLDGIANALADKVLTASQAAAESVHV